MKLKGTLSLISRFSALMYKFSIKKKVMEKKKKRKWFYYLFSAYLL